MIFDENSFIVNVNINDYDTFSIQDCVHNAMTAAMIINSFYCTKKMNEEKYLELLSQTRDLATSAIFNKLTLPSNN